MTSINHFIFTILSLLKYFISYSNCNSFTLINYSNFTNNYYFTNYLFYYINFLNCYYFYSHHQIAKLLLTINEVLYLYS
jgi:hypothetical protein